MIWRLVFLLLIVFGSCSQIASSQGSKRFDPKSYPTGSFVVSHHDYPIGKFTVRIIQVKALDHAATSNPEFCRAWLEVTDGGKLLRRAYFDDMDPVGSYFGIFLPERQPFPDYFLAIKEGDYDGRLLIVSQDGSLTNLPGGELFLTPDKRFIIGSHDSDYQSLFVIDISRHRVVIDGEKEKLPAVGGLYLDNAGYFFIGDDESGGQPDPSKKIIVIYRVDLKRFTVKQVKIAADRLKLARKVESISWRQSPDCGSAR